MGSVWRANGRGRIGLSFGAGAAIAFLVACAPTPPVVLPPAALPARLPGFEDALTLARSFRDRAEALSPPTSAALLGAADDGGAMALREWAASRRDVTQAAQRAYDVALLATYDKSDMAGIHAEVAELWLNVLEDSKRALLAAAPAEYRDDPVFLSATQGATSYALRALTARVADHLDWCARLGGRTTCIPVAQRFALATDPRPAYEPPPAPAPAAVAITDRPVLPTTRPKPCTFRGTLVTRGAVYAAETGGAVVLPVGESAPIEVDALDTPSRPGGRYKVKLAWPQVVEGYLAADEPPFVLTRQAALAAEIPWATQGARVDASDARGPTVRLTPAGERVAGANAAERRFFCHDLDLATSPHNDPGSFGDRRAMPR
jgi:hypothetical protein